MGPRVTTIRARAAPAEWDPYARLMIRQIHPNHPRGGCSRPQSAVRLLGRRPLCAHPKGTGTGTQSLIGTADRPLSGYLSLFR